MTKIIVKMTLRKHEGEKRKMKIVESGIGN
jgi:hypothetical protein